MLLFSRSYLLIISMVMVVASLSDVVRASDPADLPLQAELCIDLAASGTAIVCPPTEAYQSIAKRLAQTLEQVTKHRPRIVMDTILPDELGSGPIIVMGNMMDSQFARSLYLQAYDFIDYAWPSMGGCCVRTIRDVHTLSCLAVATYKVLLKQQMN